MSSDAGWFAEVQSSRPRLSPQEVLRAKHFRKIYAAYRSLFLDAEGNLKKEAATFLADMNDAAGMGQMGGGLSDAELREFHGRRTMVLHLINRLDRDGSKRDQLTQAIRESGG